jgi:hypothetical protein
MNVRRIAELLEELALAFRESIASPDDPEGAADAQAEADRRPPRLRIPPRPPGESDELARAAARRALREQGFMEIIKR